MSFTMENGVLKKYIEEEGVTSVSVPASVTVIGKKAFAGCQLTAVELPEGLTKIEDSAFENCKNLRRVALPQSVTSLGAMAFS